MKRSKLIDLLTEEHGLEKKEAMGLIFAGKVLVDDEPEKRPGAAVSPNSNIRIKKSREYVSRGAYKLLTALKEFVIKITDRICVDIGSSTGGFTQVLLEHGAKTVYAVDCGRNLLDYSLRTDKRVVVKEGIKAADLSSADIGEKAELAVMDVSFCSSINVIKHLYADLGITEMIVLVKPQFEYFRTAPALGLKGSFDGVIKDEKVSLMILDFVIKEITGTGLKVLGYAKSGIKGTKGNIEYLCHIKAPDR